jgi:hypothetical protein
MAHRQESSLLVGRGFFGTTSRPTQGDLSRTQLRLSAIENNENKKNKSPDRTANYVRI